MAVPLVDSQGSEMPTLLFSGHTLKSPQAFEILKFKPKTPEIRVGSMQLCTTLLSFFCDFFSLLVCCVQFLLLLLLVSFLFIYFFSFPRKIQLFLNQQKSGST